jgi:ABC-type branched-subunit amino acid transport system ATPase component
LDATVVLVSQEILPALACADRVAVFHEGKVAAVGPALEIARDRELLMRCGIDFHYQGEVWRQVAGLG